MSTHAGHTSNLPDVPYAQLQDLYYRSGLLSTYLAPSRPGHQRAVKGSRRRWIGRGRG